MTTSTLPARSTLRAIRATAVAVSQDGARPLLTCVQVKQHEGQVTVCGTDSYRLVHTTFADLKSSYEREFLVPGDLIRLIRKVFPRKQVLRIPADDTLTLHQGGDRIQVSYDGQVLSAPKVVGEYIQWRHLIPDEVVSSDVVAWNPAYLADIAAVHTEMGWDNQIPVRLVASVANKPSTWRMVHAYDGTVDYHLMPVRFP